MSSGREETQKEYREKQGNWGTKQHRKNLLGQSLSDRQVAISKQRTVDVKCFTCPLFKSIPAQTLPEKSISRRESNGEHSQ